MKIIKVIVICLILSSCKYEDGPSISFRSAEKRIQGKYDIKKYTVGGYDSTEVIKSKPCYDKLNFDTGNIDGNQHSPSCYFSGGYGFNSDNTRITIDLSDNFPNTAPLGTDWTLSWEITELRVDEMTFKTYYQGMEVILELKQ